jgi:hypothetical protein
MLGSDCDEQRALNSAIRDYILRIAEECRNLRRYEEKDFGIAVSAYANTQEALRLTNTQREKWVNYPIEIHEASQAFDSLVEVLDEFADLFPVEIQPVFWKARAFKKPQKLSASLNTPGGTMKLGVERDEKDPRWFLFAERVINGEVKKEKSEYYLNAGTLSGKGSLTAVPLYDEESGIFWGAEVLWTTRTGDRYAWEVKLDTRYAHGFVAHFSLTRENPIPCSENETRQGDVVFSPAHQLWEKFKDMEDIPIIFQSCEFDPAPVGWLDRTGSSRSDDHGKFLIKFPGSTGRVKIVHADHRIVNVDVGTEGLFARSVGGHNVFVPEGRSGD